MRKILAPCRVANHVTQSRSQQILFILAKCVHHATHVKRVSQIQTSIQGIVVPAAHAGTILSRDITAQTLSITGLGAF